MREWVVHAINGVRCSTEDCERVARFVCGDDYACKFHHAEAVEADRRAEPVKDE